LLTTNTSKIQLNMYIVNLIKELNIWRKVRSVANENKKSLNEAGFRVDWVGRIYTVINLPEEVINQPISREGYVLMKLREYDSLFLNMGIADAIAPEIIELTDADAYLLILSPDRDFIKIKPALWFTIKLTVIFLIGRVIYRIGLNYWNDILVTLNKVYYFLF
jgi:hypothetical protein